MATCIGSVVMLVKTGSLSLGPGLAKECQPTTTMCCLDAASTAAACSVASMAPRMMASGLSAIAWLSASERPETVPWPSSSRNFQPTSFAASATPSPTPRAPPLRWSVDT